MFATLKAHFSKVELVSLIQTFVATLAIDAAMQAHAVFYGDFSKQALVALALAVVRSFLKACWSLVVAAKAESVQQPTPPPASV